MRSLNIGIVGGSLAGLFTAILLRSDGHNVTVFERSAHGLAGRGAGLVAQADLFRMLRAIGCEHLAHVGVVAQERIFLASDGRVAERIATPQTQISWDTLYSTVAAMLPPEHYRLGTMISQVEQHVDSVTVKFADGQCSSFDLVVGADGVASTVRTVINANSTNRFAGYVAWRGIIAETRLPAAASILLNRFTFYVTKGIHALGYLVPGPKGEMEEGTRRYNWVWYRKVSADELPDLFTGARGKKYDFSLPRGELTPSRQRALAADAFAFLPPQFALTIDATRSPFIQGIFDYESERMVSHRTALVGDAAFVVRPHTAMGVAKAAGDVLALRKALAETGNLSDALKRYERERITVGREISHLGKVLGGVAL
ncbi:FAD-dependent monooxygenase [Ensifer adhaerens]|uniref:FAD binding domain-containing protein n=1 Tax=Ensifer adhaerens TaxID=106592 RepID=UPI001CBF4996|nr:FAD-dependent monooxygenase [Ensifer adhaerens]MBZ7927735.1 FAD-dependent monooxygenase [Ensifer adhaerens]UAX96622.1 FAD-dependent monooxygenase [Ensifer adhaerens]UAY04034.1 FAD-dependent monooxygenase [Ensifer adhaerens]UAY12020.1 FAD-dependent monooxygenase [Ensifer adhaerens]